MLEVQKCGRISDYTSGTETGTKAPTSRKFSQQSLIIPCSVENVDNLYDTGAHPKDDGIAFVNTTPNTGFCITRDEWIEVRVAANRLGFSHQFNRETDGALWVVSRYSVLNLPQVGQSRTGKDRFHADA